MELDHEGADHAPSMPHQRASPEPDRWLACSGVAPTSPPPASQVESWSEEAPPCRAMRGTDEEITP
jgi:hypothetical protein